MNTHFKAIHEQYVFWLDTLGFASIRKYSDRVRDFFQWLENKNITCITRITQNHITDFFDCQQTRKNKRFGGTLSDNYLNDYFIAIDKLCEFLHQMGAKNMPLPLNYRITIDNEERVKKIIPFTIEEIKLLQATIPDTYPDYKHEHREKKHYQIKLIFALHYACGLRFSEGYNLTANDIDFNKKRLFVQQGKGYKDRIVPITDNIYNTLQDYIYNFRNFIKCDHNRLFIHSNIALLNSLKDLQRTCKSEEVKNKLLHFHVLRHSIATHLLQNGMSVENIARFLGHNTLTSTQIYTHIINR